MQALKKSSLIKASLILIILGMESLMAIEEPGYAVVSKTSEFEVRKYENYLIAETTIQAPFDEAGSMAFRILADYIFGNNRSQTKISMTAPVQQTPVESQKIAMTAPVIQSESEGGFNCAFVMPSNFTLETLPLPNDPRITIREVPGELRAVRRYSGSWSQKNYAKQEEILLNAVNANGYEIVGAPTYARYNSPFSISFLRRNEVMVTITQP